MIDAGAVHLTRRVVVRQTCLIGQFLLDSCSVEVWPCNCRAVTLMPFMVEGLSEFAPEACDTFINWLAGGEAVMYVCVSLVFIYVARKGPLGVREGEGSLVARSWGV